MTHFITYSLETGQHIAGGSCAPTDLFKQMREGVGVVEVLRDPLVPVEAEVAGQTVTLLATDPEAAREALLHVIDLTAGVAHGNVSSKFPGLEQAHAAKAAEARAWKRTAKPDDYPILNAEAEARGVSIAEVQEAIIAKADAADAARAAIESARITAKLAVAAAGNVGAMVEASNVDWQALPS